MQSSIVNAPRQAGDLGAGFEARPLSWRTGSEILGTVFLHVDYSTPVEALRAQARRMVEAAPEWDRRVFAVQVTDATERTLQVRILVSARNAAKAFDLRCRIREDILAFLAREYPQCLPQVRSPVPEPVTV